MLIDDVLDLTTDGWVWNMYADEVIPLEQPGAPFTAMV